jgi:translation initiation factor 1
MSAKKRIDLSSSTQGVPLNSAFSSLDAGGLPAGNDTKPAPAPVTPSVPKPGRLGRVVLRCEKAHRGGKTVIVIHDFAPHIGMRYIEELAGSLKSACGCGGTARDRTIEIQGDQPARIRALLEQEGFRVAGVT